MPSFDDYEIASKLLEKGTNTSNTFFLYRERKNKKSYIIRARFLFVQLPPSRAFSNFDSGHV